MMPLKIQNLKYAAYRIVEQGVLLPHEVFANIYHRFPMYFKKMFVPSADKLKEFWRRMAGHPNFDEHFKEKGPGMLTHGVLISIHGDAVPVTGVGKS